jgi:preprotein translocase subunit SecE
VVLITVIFLTVFIGLLDWLFSVSILELFKP